MAHVRTVLDTNVVVSGLRSRSGASFRVLERLGRPSLETVVSVPLVLEYEATLLRLAPEIGLSVEEVGDVLDYLCAVSLHQRIHFLWRPVLRDPRDEMVLEAAVAAEADAITTHNRRDFAAATQFGVGILTPHELLARLEAYR